MPPKTENPLLQLTDAQRGFLDESSCVAADIVEAAFVVAPELAAEIFPSEERKSREQILAHKIIEYVGQTDTTEHDLAGKQTVVDALIELAPGNYNAGSRRQKKARTALNEWFDLEHEGKRLIGASLLSVIEHHEKRVAQVTGELRNKILDNETEPPVCLLTTSEGLGLYHLQTKSQLQAESAVTGHCVGTGSSYSNNITKGTHHYFSLRDSSVPPNDPFYHTTIEYDIDQKRIRQVRGRSNQGVNLESPHLLSVVESLVYIRDVVAGVDPSEFRVTDFGRGQIEDTNFEKVCQVDVGALKVISALEGLRVPLKIFINDEFDPDTLDEVAEFLDNYEIKELVFEGNDAKTLSKVIEKIGFINGDITCSHLETAEGLEFLERVDGSAHFLALKSSVGLEALKEIVKDADFPVLEDASGLVSLTRIGGKANFPMLKSSKGLGSLEEVNHHAKFSVLTDASDLTALRILRSGASFGQLQFATGLSSLESVEGDLRFSALVSGAGLSSLREISGDAIFPALEDATGLASLETIGGRAFFGALESSTGLEALQRIGKGAHFFRLKDAKGLSALSYIGARAHFEKLLSATGLEKLTYIGGRTFLNKLPNPDGLENVEYIGGALIVDSLDVSQRRELRKRVEPKRKRRRRT